MKELEYPFDARYLIKKKRSLKRELLAADMKYTEKKIAVLGGSTTHDIAAMLELFLLNFGIRPEIYESEYNQYWEDVMFDNPKLIEFAPDIIHVHTTNRNLTYPSIGMSQEDTDNLLNSEYEKFAAMWEKIENTYHCPVIQNNFEFPTYRILGNSDCYNTAGHVNFINSMNARFAKYAREHKDFYIEDIQYLSASYGLDAWADPLYWHMYKYALSMEAIPTLSYLHAAGGAQS